MGQRKDKTEEIAKKSAIELPECTRAEESRTLASTATLLGSDQRARVASRSLSGRDYSSTRLRRGGHRPFGRRAEGLRGEARLDGSRAGNHDEIPGGK